MRSLVALLLVAAFVAGCSPDADAQRLARRVAEALAAPTAPVARGGATSASDEAQVEDVVRRANAAQQRAFQTGDPTPLRETATDAYYQEMVRINRDLANAGVTAIELLDLRWGGATIDGTTAQATTDETWRSTYTDGSVDVSVARNDYTLTKAGGAWRIDGNVQPGARVDRGGSTPPAQSDPVLQDTSSNWSGYVASGGSFTSVSGTWIVPDVSATTPGADATWVGIGGTSSRDLIQAGTQSAVAGDGSVRYSAWTETLPESSRTVSLTVRPGDVVNVTIGESSAGSWRIAMRNVTSGETYSENVRYSSSRSSAEWIEEAPSAGRGVLPLSRFGAVRFTAASAVKDGKTIDLKDADPRAVTMINAAREPLAVPSPIATDGSFTITRTQASSTTPGAGGRPRRG